MKKINWWLLIITIITISISGYAVIIVLKEFIIFIIKILFYIGGMLNGIYGIN